MSERIPFEDYKALEGVNWSKLKNLWLGSPLHYRYGLTAPDKDTPAKMLGRAVHTATLEPERFDTEYAVFGGEGTRATKEYKTWAAEHAGMGLLKLDEYEEIVAIRDAVRTHELARPYMVPGDIERTIVWDHPEHGIRCKGRIDKLVHDIPGMGRVLVDLKTARSIESKMFGGQACRLGYPAQLAHYEQGLAAIGEPVDKVVILAVESTPPHDVGVFVLTDAEMEWGRDVLKDLFRRLVFAQTNNKWPGRYAGEEVLSLPQWAFPEDDDPATFGLNLEN